MKGIVWGLTSILLLTLTACAKNPASLEMEAIYNKYETHCREHARDTTGEVDQQGRYEECMAYFVNTDPDCPLDEIDPHLSKSK